MTPALLKKHMDRIAEMGCLVCKRPAQVHHERWTPAGNIGRDDRYVAPLCDEHHLADYPHSRHKLGHEGFRQMYYIDLHTWARIQWRATERLHQ